MHPSSILASCLLFSACASSPRPATRPRAVDAPDAVRARIAALLGAGAEIEVDGPVSARTYEGEARTEISVEVDASGALLGTEVAVPVAALPTAVAAAATARGPMKEAELVVTATGVMFEVEVTTATGTIELMIDAAGTVVSDRGDEDDDDEDDEHDGRDHDGGSHDDD